jgi:DNA-binding CsgD family transcriptional regulator
MIVSRLAAPGVTEAQPAAFLTDDASRIVLWNAGVERLLDRTTRGQIPAALSTMLMGGGTGVLACTELLQIPGPPSFTVYSLHSREEAGKSCPLTERELEILGLLSDGYSSLNIAARLSLSHATVRNHVQRILQKMNVHSQVQAVAVSLRKRWIGERGSSRSHDARFPLDLLARHASLPSVPRRSKPL